MRPPVGRPDARSYSALAEEYYKEGRHPTCEDFRDASRQILEAWLPPSDRKRTILEVGAGRSLVAQQLGDPLGLIALDSTREMLDHSLELPAPPARLVLADARELPFRDGSIDVLVSILGDPYDTPEFWSEAARVLAPTGAAILTTPARAWVEAFRGGADHAEFELEDGTVVRVPSVVRTPEDQRRAIEAHGLGLKEVFHVRIGDLDQVRSWKLLQQRGREAPVVTGYLAVPSGS